MKVRVAHQSLPKQGELRNGDLPLHRADDEGRHLLAVIDALGHGPGAAEVSEKIGEFLAGVPLDRSLLDIMQGAHRAVGGLRGAAMTLCLLRSGKLEACGVGNVELRSGGLNLPLLLSPGILGVRVAKFRCCEVDVRSNGRLALFSDGISTRLRLDALSDTSPEHACGEIMNQYRRDHDDATILVADLEQG